MAERVVTECPICKKPLRVNVYDYIDTGRELIPNACQGSRERICNKINDCPHYHWVPIGNACYENPEISDICEGVEQLIANSIDEVYDGTTVWLLVPTQLK